MSITASTPSKRVALASVNTNIHSPLFNKTNNHGTSPLGASCTRMLPLTRPNLTSKTSLGRTSTSLSPYSLSRTKSMHNYSINKKKFSNLKSSSFSDYKISNNKNITADLAATKLKLKLQLAFYKVQQQYNNSVNSRKIFPAIPSTTKLSSSLSSSSAAKVSPNISASSTPSFTMNNSNLITVITPPSPTANYQSSININLQTNLKSAAPTRKVKPSLSSIALNKKNTTNNQKLKLFQIKKTSSFYNVSHNNLMTSGSKLPLIESDLVKLSRPIFNSTNGASTRPLPPINKILKTPIKTASSTRNLINSFNHATVTNTDETIDESMDDTSLALAVKSKDNLLTSSPLKENNSFGTPNSFSVAKSLLQLGSGYYQWLLCVLFICLF